MHHDTVRRPQQQRIGRTHRSKDSPHMPADAGPSLFRFHSTNTTPAVGPLEVKMRSCISTLPRWPLSPTLIRGRGCLYCMYKYRESAKGGVTIGGTHFASSKFLPKATSCAQFSPTIRRSLGIFMVSLIMYEPRNRRYPTKLRDSRRPGCILCHRSCRLLQYIGIGMSVLLGNSK